MVQNKKIKNKEKVKGKDEIWYWAWSSILTFKFENVDKKGRWKLIVMN